MKNSLETRGVKERLKTANVRKIIFFVVVLLLVVTGGVKAGGHLEVVGAVFKEMGSRGPNGKITWKTVPITESAPGAEVSYVITFKNAGDQPLLGATAAHPVPAEVEFISTSFVKKGVSQATFEVSVDHGTIYGNLSDLKIPQDADEPRKAKAQDVTDVRWQVQSPIDAGEEISVSFRGRVKQVLQRKEVPSVESPKENK
jgi:uncharacterized repeat protein (TIGR01451 family)